MMEEVVLAYKRILTIKSILDDVRFSYIWNNQHCNNTKWIAA